MTMNSCACDPVVERPTIQTFLGKRYYLCGNYFSRETSEPRIGGRSYLHRMVWISANGPVPGACYIHHCDGDRTNNALANLACVSPLGHSKIHATPERRRIAQVNIKKAIAAAPEWHRSPEGLAWHREHGKACWADKPYSEYICIVCGNVFESRSTRKTPSRFCGMNCKARHFRATHPGYNRRFRKNKSQKQVDV